MSQSPYINRREAAKSYRPKAGTMSPGLQRAREPYRVKNAILGLALGAFAVGVWAYSISAVKQDVFDDVDEEVAVLSAGTKSKPPAGAGEESEHAFVASASRVPTVSADVAGVLAEAVSTEAGDSQRGILPRLEKHLPGWFALLDPERKTLVWGASSVDNMGKLSDKS